MRATDRDCLPVRPGALALLGVLLSAAVGFAQPAPAPGPPGKVLVADVIPQGNHAVPTQRIMNLIKTRPGAEYTKATVDEDVRRLYETRLFRNVEVRIVQADDAKVFVYFLVMEYPSLIQDIV